MFLIDYLLEYNRYMNVLGVLCVLLVAFFFSKNRARINYRLVAIALAMQFGLGLIMLRTTWGVKGVQAAAGAIGQLYVAGGKGVEFLFGKLIDPTGSWGPIFAFKVLPLIIFFGALTSILLHYGVVQWVAGWVARLLRPLFGTSGAETLSVSASCLGQTEAPMLVRHYIKNMTHSEMLTIMIGGMGTISLSVLAIYVSMNVPAAYLLSAVVMAIPSSILMAKILYPEAETPETAAGREPVQDEDAKSSNVLEAIAKGTSAGLMLALNVGAMLIAFIALIALVNALLGWGSGQLNYWFDIPLLSATPLQHILSYCFAPVGWLLGLTGPDLFRASELLGIKVIGNEFLAYSEMVKMTFDSERAQMLTTYILCGFANLSSIGIQIGGIGTLAPNQRPTIAKLGLLAVLGGTLANILSAMVAGICV
jgi:CNT family concentrative nucleoside transporter